MRVEKINLKIGDYTLKSIPTGIFGLDGGAMFGVVPKNLWAIKHKPDEQNRIALESRVLLLESMQHKIIIDTGNGGDFILKHGERLGSKFASLYNIPETLLIDNLAKHGIKPDDVTHVILTHLHFDHAGGATTKGKKSKLVPTFKNAKHFIQKSNLENALNPNPREKASYYKANFEPLLEFGILDTIDGDCDLMDNISVAVFDGHTVGMQAVKIHDDNTTLIYCSDAIPTTSHVKLAWGMGYDVNPLLVVKEKQLLLKEASKKNWYLYFQHDPTIECAKVKDNGRDFEIHQTYCLNN